MARTGPVQRRSISRATISATSRSSWAASWADSSTARSARRLTTGGWARSVSGAVRFGAFLLRAVIRRCSARIFSPRSKIGMWPGAPAEGLGGAACSRAAIGSWGHRHGWIRGLDVCPATGPAASGFVKRSSSNGGITSIARSTLSMLLLIFLPVSFTIRTTSLPPPLYQGRRHESSLRALDARTLQGIRTLMPVRRTPGPASIV